MSLTKLAFYIGILWLAASIWVTTGGDQKVIWMLMIPAVYVIIIQLLRE